MGSFDLLIIYLAIGAPFAVYRVTGGRWLTPVRLAQGAGIGLFFWPFLAIRLLIGSASRRERRTKAKPDARIEKLRSDIERLALSEARPETLFRFREAFYRLSGLSTASRPRADSRPFEFFEMSQHPNATLATVCLARRNADRVVRHRSQAFLETATLLREGSESSRAIDLLTAAFPGSQAVSISRASVPVRNKAITENAVLPR